MAGMRAWRPEEGETAKAFAAFEVYRELGPERTLQKAAESYYGSTANLRQIQEWSRKFDWVERARGYDDWLTMTRQNAIEEYERGKAAKYAERRQMIQEGMLDVAEKALDQCNKMLDWPLTEQRVLREGEDGEQVTYIFLPTKWGKNTAQTMYNMASGAVGGLWSTRTIEEEAQAEYDFSDLTDEEMQAYIELSEKLGVRQSRR